MVLLLRLQSLLFTHMYTLSLHAALPISPRQRQGALAAAHHQRGGSATGRAARAPLRTGPRRTASPRARRECRHRPAHLGGGDRKSTRLNSSHVAISYAVFCLKKKNIYIS